MKINLEIAWNEIKREFDPKKIFHFFALTNLLRYTLEKEKLKRDMTEFEEINYSIMHNMIHTESIEVDKQAFLESLINNLSRLPNVYDIEIILKKLINILPSKDNLFWKVEEFPNKIHKIYNLKLFSINVFSYNPLFYIYSGKKEKEEEGIITFLSNKKMELYNVYKIGVGYGKINNNIKFFIEFSNENISKKIREGILVEYKIDNGFKLFNLMKGEIWPLKNFSERKLIMDTILFFANPFSKNNKYESLYPFLQKPYFNKTLANLSNYFVDKIIQAYNYDSDIKKAYNLKKELDKKNNPCFKNRIDKISFFKQKNNNLYYEEYLKDIENFESLFVSFEKKEKIFLTKDQEKEKIIVEIINKLKSKRTIILRGPAGHGKSYSLKKIMEIYKNNNKNVGLVCPTWKAIEVYEGINHYSTIKGLETKEKFFENLDLLIIDEMTLIGKWDFIGKICKKTQIIISGDPNQLQPLNLVVKKYKWLMKIAGPKNTIDLTNKKNYRVNETINKNIINIQKKLIQEKFDYKKNIKGVKYFSSDEKIFEALVEYSKKDFTIITPNNGGLFGVNFINKFIIKKIDNEFKKGDKIVFFRNKKNHYYNGLFGEIIEITRKINIEPEINLYKIRIRNGRKIKVINTVDNDLPFSYSYAINAHKAQGSTINKVLVLVPKNVGYDWLYTAYSRASEDAIIIFKTNSFTKLIKRI